MLLRRFQFILKSLSKLASIPGESKGTLLKVAPICKYLFLHKFYMRCRHIGSRNGSLLNKDTNGVLVDPNVSHWTLCTYIDFKVPLLRSIVPQGLI